MHFCAEPDKLTTLVSHPNFIASRILNSKCVIVYMRSKRCFFQRPYIVGVTVLDLSKLQMYSDYYFLLVPALNGQVSLMMTDTGIVDISIVTSSPNCRDAFLFSLSFFFRFFFAVCWIRQPLWGSWTAQRCVWLFQFEDRQSVVFKRESEKTRKMENWGG